MKAIVNLETILSVRQYEIAQRLGKGQSIPQVAAQLGIKPGTINRGHMRQIRKRLGVRSCAELRAAIRAASKDA